MPRLYAKIKFMSKSVSFYTLGCRLNQTETASLQNSFEKNGYRVVDADQSSDIVVINTCTVTEGGDADTRRLVYKANRINPQTRIALIGCQAQVQKEKLTGLPNVRWVVGNERKLDLAAILNEIPDPQSPQVITPTIQRAPFTQPVAAIDRQHTRANLKIQDGCDFFCTFCEIPYARGRARSRVFEDIFIEALQLVEAGHREIVLTGINIGTYADQGKNLLDVILELEKIPGLARIRISSIEPTTIPRKLISLMTPEHKLCRYLHIPIQSGDDSVLSKMERRYTVSEFKSFIEWAHEAVPEICLGTDVIVGFPGESEESFSNTENLLQELPLDYFHVFSYSSRTMTKSRNFQENVSSQAIKSRSERLRDLGQRKRRLLHDSLLGTMQSVLFEEKKDGLWLGLTDNYVRVSVQSSENLYNQIREVNLESINQSGITGKIYDRL